MSVSNEALDHETLTRHEIEQARFGHDPSELRPLHRGELLDETWEQEFDRRLAAWEAESPAPTTTTRTD